MFEDPNALKPASRPHPDGKDDRAVAIMRQYPALSLRDLSKLLAANGIRRGKDWIRQHRCD